METGTRKLNVLPLEDKLLVAIQLPKFTRLRVEVEKPEPVMVTIVLYKPEIGVRAVITGVVVFVTAKVTELEVPFVFVTETG